MTAQRRVHLADFVGVDPSKWVWLKIKQQGLRRCWPMFPLTRVPFWYRLFEPPPNNRKRAAIGFLVGTQGVLSSWPANGTLLNGDCFLETVLGTGFFVFDTQPGVYLFCWCPCAGCLTGFVRGKTYPMCLVPLAKPRRASSSASCCGSLLSNCPGALTR